MRLGQRGLALSLTLRPDFQYEAGLGHGKLIKQLNVASLAAWDADKLRPCTRRSRRLAHLCRTHARQNAAARVSTQSAKGQ
jgi:DNA mismatch repair protein MutS